MLTGFLEKKLHQLVIPRFHGSYDIPSVSFTYFDLNKKKYKTLYHPSTTIQVAKSEKQQQYLFKF